MTAAVAAAVRSLAPVELATVEADANLQTRVDRKYLLPVPVFTQLVLRLGDRLCALQLAGERTFCYESVYFDTPELISYHATAHRRPRRFKVRTRAYLDSQQCMLELKARSGRAETVKHRLPCLAADRHRIDADARDFLLARGVSGGVVARLAPVLITAYRRATLVDPAAAYRITCDTDPVWSTPEGAVATLDGVVLVETKSAGRATAADRLLWALGHRPQSISKYGSGLAVLRPDLPANAWNRVLRRHFGWSPARAQAAFPECAGR